MPRLRCLLCDANFDKETNHLCARECLPSAGHHFDFCKSCRIACLKALASQMAETPVRERREDRPRS